MKKILAAIAIFLFAATFVFAADLYDVTADSSILASLTKEEQNYLIQQAAEEGVKVTFDKEGNMTLYDSETNETVVLMTDGTAVVYDENGAMTGAVRYGMQANEFTKQIPNPEDFGFKVELSAYEDGEFIMSLSDAEKEKAEKYLDALKKKGFTVDPEEECQDLSAYGMYMLVYFASNKSGYHVNYVFMDYTGTKSSVIRIGKN